jgi:hypothetical protein
MPRQWISSTFSVHCFEEPTTDQESGHGSASGSVIEACHHWDVIVENMHDGLGGLMCEQEHDTLRVICGPEKGLGLDGDARCEIFNKEAGKPQLRWHTQMKNLAKRSDSVGGGKL